MRYRVTVYRRQGVTMQTYNCDTLAHALSVQQTNAGQRGVYKIELAVIVETWVFDTSTKH